MGRPALQQLLADITAGRVDIVVVYKIELTRSLADFAKIVEILDARSKQVADLIQVANRTLSQILLTVEWPGQYRPTVFRADVVLGMALKGVSTQPKFLRKTPPALSVLATAADQQKVNSAGFRMRAHRTLATAPFPGRIRHPT
jgi:hypothetical protein